MTTMRARLAETDHFLLVARLSLILAVVNTNEHLWAFIATLTITIVVFLQPRWLRTAWPWFVLGTLIGVSQALSWWMIDDHLVATTYWLFAVGLSRLALDPRRFLAVSARLLVGLVFAFAFGWKLLSSQYVSTDFFRYQILADERFSLVAEHVGGTDDAELRDAQSRLATLSVQAEAGEPVVLAEGERNALVATVFTLWGLVIEGAIALAFLLPLTGRWLALRPATLFAFSYTTYAVVPVAGFAALLMTLGLAVRDTERLRLAHVVSFGVLLLWGAIFPVLV